MATAAENKAEKDAETAAGLGLGDHRPLTTADLPALAEYVKQASAPKRSTSSAKAKKPSSGKKGANS